MIQILSNQNLTIYFSFFLQIKILFILKDLCIFGNTLQGSYLQTSMGQIT